MKQKKGQRPHSGPDLEEQASLLYAWPQRPFSWPPLSASSLSLQEPFCESRTRLCWGARGARVARQGGVLLVARGVLSGIENFFLIIMKCRDYWHKKADAPDWHIAISQIDVVMIVTVRSRLNTQKVSLCQGLRSAYGKDLGVAGNQKFLVKPISFFLKLDFCMVFAKSV